MCRWIKILLPRLLELVCVCYVFMRVCLYVLCGHLLGKGWPLGSRLWCLTVILSLSLWYPGSVVVLDCIDSWSLHPYLLSWTPPVPYINISSQTIHIKISHDMKFQKMWYQRQAKGLANLHIHADWSEPLLVIWIFYGCLALYPTAFGVFKLKMRLHRLLWVYSFKMSHCEISCPQSSVFFSRSDNCECQTW